MNLFRNRSIIRKTRATEIFCDETYVFQHGTFSWEIVFEIRNFRRRNARQIFAKSLFILKKAVLILQDEIPILYKIDDIHGSNKLQDFAPCQEVSLRYEV